MIPVTVLTGFLGSGKTTLLSRLLRDPAMARTAVIINEFGDIGLDHDLIETSDESFVRLSNGCLCCNVRSDLTLTLGELAQRRKQGAVPAFERVVIETSGLADPAPIMHALMADAEINGVYRLGGVVATVDALLGLATLEQHIESRRQAAVADRIIVTKTDLEGARAEEVCRRIAALNPGAQVIEAVRGGVAPDVLFAAPERQPGMWLEHHRHTADIASFCLVRKEPLHAATLALLMSALAENCGADLLRMKGIVNVREDPLRPAVIHGVQHVVHAPVWLPRWPSEDRRSRLVFIGRDLREGWVRDLIELLEEEVAEQVTALSLHRRN
jgi:G3E family GTPase